MKTWIRIGTLIGLIPVAAMGIGNGAYIHAKAIVAQYLLEEAWEEARHGSSQPRPWPWFDSWPVARLKVPSLQVDQILLSGASGRVLAFAPGHITGTAIPGEVGTVGLSGHRDTHFRWLQYLHDGDEIQLETKDGDKLDYRVVRHAVHHENDASILQDTDAEILRLITCYPFDSLIPGGPLRYVVSARRVF